MKIPASSQVEAIISETAQAEILPRFRNLAEGDVWAKTHARDLVTTADIESERVLTRRLGALLPGSCVLGEEACAANPSVMNLLDGDDPVWIIDPVDGTMNFSKGHPQFGMIVALAWKGRTVAGWIYDPINDRFAIAEEGGGAFLAGEKVRLTPGHDDPMQLSGFLGDRALKTPVGRIVRVASAAHNYLLLADGEIDFALFTRLMPWDHAAGCLLLTEAGGESRLMDGRLYAPGAHRSSDKNNCLLLARGTGAWNALCAAIVLK